MAIAFEEAQSRGADLEAAHSERNSMFEELEKMYLLQGEGLPKGDWVKDTISSDPRDTLQGAQRLLVAADPTWNVPTISNTPGAKRVSSAIEKFASAAWQAIGRLNNAPPHYDVALSALLYGEIHLTVTLVSDMAKTARTPAQKRAVEDASKQTPFIIECINPALGYPSWGRLGLVEYYSKRELAVSEIRERWGSDALKDRKATDRAVLCDYWDLENHVVWVDGETAEYLNAPHNLPYIPVVAVIAEGSRLFYRTDQQTRQPFLYSLWKTNLWKRQNLALTLMYSLAFSIGANPLFVYQRKDEGRTAPIRDFSTPGGLVVLDQNESYVPLAKQVLDPSLMQILQVAQDRAESATIYKQTLGAPIAGNNTFSAVSLLSQSGRLPLTSYQRMASFAIGKAMQVAICMAREVDGGSFKAMGDKGQATLDAKTIPDTFDLQAKLDVTLPQDDRQMVAVAAQAVGGDRPLTSMRYARERFLNIGQSDDMDQEIVDEMMMAQVLQARAQQMMQELMAQQQPQQPQQPGAPGAMPPGMTPPPGAPQPGQQDPNAMLAQLQQTGAQAGLPGMPAGAPMEPGIPGGIGETGGNMPPEMAGM